MEVVDFKGTQMQGRSWYVSAKQMLLTNAFSSYEETRSNKGVDLTLPLLANVMPGVGLVPINKHSADIRDYVLMTVSMAENIAFEISGRAVLEGAAIEADSIVMNMGELVIKAAEKVANIKGNGFSFGIGDATTVWNILTNGGINYERGNAKWVDEVTSIIGREKVELVVAGVMELVGSMVANAEKNPDGTYTDKGNLKVKAAELIVENIHGYDNGVLLDTSIAKGTANGIIGNTFGFKFGYKDREQIVQSTLGNGIIDVGSIKGDNLGRDINNVKQEDGTGFNLQGVYASVDFSRVRELFSPNTFVENVKSGLSPITKIASTVANWFAGDNAQAQETAENSEIDEEMDRLIEEIDQMMEEVATEEQLDAENEVIDLDKEGNDEDTKQDIAKSLIDKMKAEYGEEAQYLVANGMKSSLKYLNALKGVEASYVVEGNKLIIVLPETGTVKAAAGTAAGIELAFEVVGEVGSQVAIKGAIQVGKFFVRVAPYGLAALTAYEIGKLVYEQALREKNDDL